MLGAEPEESGTNWVGIAVRNADNRPEVAPVDALVGGGGEGGATACPKACELSVEAQNDGANAVMSDFMALVATRLLIAARPDGELEFM